MAIDGRVNVMFKSNVTEIGSKSGTIAVGETTNVIQDDAVIISAGGILSTTFLQWIGINVETKW